MFMSMRNHLAMAGKGSGQRVFLHVGTPKSGTTFLQASLAHNSKALQKAGVLYCGTREEMFLAALDVRRNHKAWGRQRKDTDGAWDAVCHRARRHRGTSVISHELLGAASEPEIGAALKTLRGLEVHVVVTTRDLARQSAAEWQEGIKHGRRLTFEEFRRRVLAVDSETDYALRFRAAQELPALLGRWSAETPRARVHLVCCPRPASEPDLLWRRFAGAIDPDIASLPTAGPEHTNASLGSVETDLLRRVNIALAKRLEQPHYGELAKRLYAQRLLGTQSSARPVVPPDMYDELRTISERWVKDIANAGYTVHGDLDELIPEPPDAQAPHPDDVDPGVQVDVAARSTAELLLEIQRYRARNAQLQERNAELEKRRSKLRHKLTKARKG